MRLARLAATALTLSISAAPALAADARDHAFIVGPGLPMEIVDLVTERAARAGAPPARVERMGTPEAVAAFCAGTGPAHPDALGTLRPLTVEETAACAANGVTAPRAVPLLMDAAVLVAAADGPLAGLTAAQLHRAVARELEVGGRLVPNPHRTWRDIDPALPDLPIALVLPPPQSGTWVFFADRVLEPACAAQPALHAMPAERKREICRAARTDAVVPTAPAAVRTVATIAERPGAVGLIGYPFAVLNGKGLRMLALDGVAPERAAVASGAYPLSRPLTLLIKAGAEQGNPGMAALLAELAPGRALGDTGYLATTSPLPPPAR